MDLELSQNLCHKKKIAIRQSSTNIPSLIAQHNPDLSGSQTIFPTLRTRPPGRCGVVSTAGYTQGV